MMTIGDVLGVAGLLLGLGICSWAVMMSAALLFPMKCKIARESLENDPWHTLLRGLLMLSVGLLIGLTLLKMPVPLAKLAGVTLLTFMLSVAAIGSGGLAFLVGARIRAIQDDLSEYQCACRGSALIFLCSLTPLLGTFFLAPLCLAAAIGAGVKALRVRPLAAPNAGP